MLAIKFEKDNVNLSSVFITNEKGQLESLRYHLYLNEEGSCDYKLTVGADITLDNIGESKTINVGQIKRCVKEEAKKILREHLDQAITRFCRSEYVMKYHGEWCVTPKLEGDKTVDAILNGLYDSIVTARYGSRRV